MTIKNNFFEPGKNTNKNVDFAFKKLVVEKANGPRKCTQCGKLETSAKFMIMKGHRKQGFFCSVKCQKKWWKEEKDIITYEIFDL